MVKAAKTGVARRQQIKRFPRGSTIQELFRPRHLAWAVAGAYGALFAGGAAWGNPSGGTVVNGQATFSQNGHTLTVTNTPGTIINWQSFSIGIGETTSFIQQSINSAVLNRVISQDPSKILGTLSSNGRVFLINPNGIVFGQGAIVDTAGLVASTLNITDEDFKSGRMRFVGSGASGDIKVAGVIRSTSGDIYLIAPNIQNEGALKAENGEVILAAGEAVEILGRGLDNIRFEVQNAGNEAVNLGSIEGDAVGLFAGTLKQAGVIKANALSVEGGKVVLRALADATLAAGSVTSADNDGGAAGSVTVQSQTGNLAVEQGALVSASGQQGGTVTLQADLGTNAISGTVKATGTLSLSGEGDAQGGLIQLLGRQVGLFGDALADASGDTGGGTILVGGDWQGANPDVQNAAATYVGVNAVIKVDANLQGDGGKAVVWSDGTTRVHGQIQARGGVNGGNGGLVETSGKGYLQVTRSPEFYARGEGAGGLWLIDPSTINITTVSSNVIGSGNEFDPFAGTTDVSELDVSVLVNALDSGGTIVVDTNSTANGAGDINVLVDVVFNGTAGEDATLLLKAHNDVNVNADITNGSPNSRLNVSLVGDQNFDGGGGVKIANGVSITTLGGTFDAVGNYFHSDGTVDTSGRAGQSAGWINVVTNGTGFTGLDAILTGNLVAQGGDGLDGTGFSGGWGGDGGRIDLYAQSGNIVITGQIDSRGGQGGDAYDAGFGSAGSGGWGGVIHIDAAGGNVTADPDLPTDVANGEVIFANGGDGGSAFNITGAVGSMGGTGGAGGSIFIGALGDIDLGFTTEGRVIAQGGRGGDGGTGSSFSSAGSGGDGGSGGAINFTTLSGAILLDNVFIQNGGGMGGDGGDSIGTSGFAGSGGDGGWGGGMNFQSGSTFSASGTTLMSFGLDGGDGGDATTIDGDGGWGGSGGGGGSIYINANGLVTISTSFIAPYTSGGAGGSGGNSLNGWGGGGGSGGDAGWIDIYSGAVAPTGILIDQDSLLGGVGGAGGNGGNGAIGGGGGNGGWGGSIDLNTDGDINVSGAVFDVSGGAGGSGGVSSGDFLTGFTNNTGGNGGYAGNIYMNAGNPFIDPGIGSIHLENAVLRANGGAGGAGGEGLENPTGIDGVAGYGGYGAGGGYINLSAVVSFMALDVQIEAHGGVGGAGGAGAGGDLNDYINGNTWQLEGQSGGYGGYAGSLSIVAGTSLDVVNGDFTLHGGTGGTGGDLTGDFAGAKAGDGGEGGNASGNMYFEAGSASFGGNFELIAGDGGAAGQAQGSAGGGGHGGNGGDAWGGFYVDAYDGDITLNGATILARGGNGADGAGAVSSHYDNGTGITYDTGPGNGGIGGSGGAISLEAYTGALIIDDSSLVTQGGDGGDGGDATASVDGGFYTGGNGGNAGTGGYLYLSALGNVSINGSLASLGGAGGAGGDALDPLETNPKGVAGYGGWGGDAGSWWTDAAIGIYSDTGNVTLTGSFVAQGGAGGDAGMLTAGLGGVGVSGGDGGWANMIHVYSPDGSVGLEGATVLSRGGNGGKGSDSTGYADVDFTSVVGSGGDGGNTLGIEILAGGGSVTIDNVSSVATVGGNGGNGGSFSELLADAANFSNSQGGNGGSVGDLLIDALDDVNLGGDVAKRSGDGGWGGVEVSDAINGTLLSLGMASAGDVGALTINSTTGSINLNAGIIDFSTGYGSISFYDGIYLNAYAGDITQDAAHGGILSLTGGWVPVYFQAPDGAVDLDSSNNRMGSIEGSALGDITIVNGSELFVYGLGSSQGDISLRVENGARLYIGDDVVTDDGWIKIETDALAVSEFAPLIGATEFIKVSPIDASAVIMTPDGSGGEIVIGDFLVLELEVLSTELVLDGNFFEAINTPLLIVDAGPDVDISIQSIDGGSIDISSTTLELIANNITQQSDTEINVDGLNVSAIGSASLIAFGNSVFGPIKADTGDDFTLYGESQFNITGVTSGGDIDIENTYNDGTGIAVHGGMSAAGSMRLATPGDIEIGSGTALTVSASSLELIGFDILQDGAAVLDVGGLNVSAVGDAYLTTNGNMVTGPITADTGGDFKLYGASAFVIDAVTSGGDVEIVNNGTGVGIAIEGTMSADGNMLLDTDGDIVIGGSGIGALTVEADTLDMFANNISQASDTDLYIGALNVSAIGSASLAAFGNSVFGPIQANTGDDFTLYGDSMFNVSSVLAGGDVDIETTYNDGTAIQVDGDVIAGGTVRLAGVGDVVIGGSGIAPLVHGPGDVNITGFNVHVFGTVQSDNTLSVDAAGDLLVAGSNSVNGVSGELLSVFDMFLDVGGTFTIQGGAADDAHATVDPSSSGTLFVNASAIQLLGGSGANSWAALLSSGDIDFLSSGSLTLQQGSGSNADAVVVALGSTLNIPDSCTGCLSLDDIDPLANPLTQQGIYGLTPDLPVDIIQEIIALLKLKDPPDGDGDDNDADIVVEGGGDACK